MSPFFPARVFWYLAAAAAAGLLPHLTAPIFMRHLRSRYFDGNLRKA